MYDEEIKTNEVHEVEPIQEEETKTSEVTPDVIYVPAPADETDKGPNKTLIAVGIAGALLIAKPAIRRVKAIHEQRKEAKERAESERIMKVLIENGLVKPKVEEPAETATPANETEVKTPADKADAEQK